MYNTKELKYIIMEYDEFENYVNTEVHNREDEFVSKVKVIVNNHRCSDEYYPYFIKCPYCSRGEIYLTLSCDSCNYVIK